MSFIFSSLSVKELSYVNAHPYFNIDLNDKNIFVSQALSSFDLSKKKIVVKYCKDPSYFSKDILPWLSFVSFNNFFLKNRSFFNLKFLTNYFSIANFNLFSKIYYSLVLKVTLNNLFITLINNSGEVLLSLSGGMVGLKGFQRRTSTALKLMLRVLIKFLKKNRLENKVLFLIFKSSWLSLRNLILADLYENGVEINFVIFDLVRCHNGLRKKKLRNR